MLSKRKKLEEARRSIDRTLEIRQSKRELVTLLSNVMTIIGDQRSEKIIAASDLSFSSLMVFHEFLFIPLKKIVPSPNSLRFSDRQTVEEALSLYGVHSFLFLDGIIRGTFNTSGHEAQLTEFGKQKDDGFRNATSLQSLKAQQYADLKYLYSSMITARIISENSALMFDAFLLAVWDNVYQTLQEGKNECVHKIISALKTIGKPFQGPVSIDEQVALLYGVLEMPPAQIKTAICCNEYLTNGRILWKDMYSLVSKHVDDFVREAEQKAYVSRLLNRKNMPRITIAHTDAMDPYMFEKLIGLVFSKMGFQTIITKGSGDQGVDVIAEKSGAKIAIQAKCYTGSVGNSAVQEVVAGKSIYRAEQACVITNSEFTASAIELARANHVILWDRKMLSQKLNELDIYVSDL